MKAPLLFLFMVVLMSLCLVSANLAEGKREKLEVPYRRPGFGVGGGSFSGVVLATEDDKKANTCAIIQAVSALPAGLIQSPADGLDAKKLYKTDYAKLTPVALTEYNQQNSDMSLAAGPLYGVAYEISYEVKKEFLVYEVKSKLYYSGSASAPWYPYSRKFNDTFFSQKLLNAIKQQLVDCAKPR